MPILQFEDLIAWQKAQDFAVEIYTSFKELKDWSFKDQICLHLSPSPTTLPKDLIEIPMLNFGNFYSSNAHHVVKLGLCCTCQKDWGIKSNEWSCEVISRSELEVKPLTNY